MNLSTYWVEVSLESDFPRVCSTSFVALVLSLVGVRRTRSLPMRRRGWTTSSRFRPRATPRHPRNTRAIVMLRPGAALPAEFAAYATRRSSIIDGYVVERAE